MSGEVKVQILNYCESVKTGSKPVAMTSIQSKHIDEVNMIVKNQNLNIYIQNMSQHNDWKVVFIYKHNHLLEVIKAMPERPSSIFDHWVLGKLFGYSEEAIRDFLDTI